MKFSNENTEDFQPLRSMYIEVMRRNPMNASFQIAKREVKELRNRENESCCAVKESFYYLVALIACAFCHITLLINSNGSLHESSSSMASIIV